MQSEWDWEAKTRALWNEQPRQETIAQIERELSASLKPVRPLPSNRVLVLVWLGIFVAVSVLGAIPVGFNGFQALSPTRKLLLYAVVGASAVLIARCVVEQMIPGLKRVISPGLAVALPILSLGILTPLMFPNFDMSGFGQGMVCLRLGLLCAAPFGVLAWLLMRRGFLTSPMMAAILGGGFAGLAGIGVLALHCAIFNASHILVWHLGVIAITTAAGAITGLMLLRVSR